MALAVLTWAEMPEDEEHAYGHSKAEYFSSGFEGVLIFAAALGIIWAAVQRLLNPQPLDAVRDKVAAAWKADALAKALADYATTAKAAVEGGASLGAYGIVEVTSNIDRQGFVEGAPDTLLPAIFEMAAGDLRVIEAAALEQDRRAQRAAGHLEARGQQLGELAQPRDPAPRAVGITHQHVGEGRRMQVAVLALDEHRAHLLDHAVEVVHPLNAGHGVQAAFEAGVVHRLVLQFLPAAGVHQDAIGDVQPLAAVFERTHQDFLRFANAGMRVAKVSGREALRTGKLLGA